MGSAESRNILIIGSGIAGTAVAFWLRRYGFRPTVLERATGLRRGGQAIDLRGAGRAVIERMGLLGNVREYHTGVRGMALVDGQGRPLVRIPASLLGTSGGPVADLEILRGDLVALLHEPTRDEVEYIFGDEMAGMEQDQDRVHVTFLHGPPRPFDLVIGADGQHSAVRRHLFGSETRFVRDLGAYLATYTMQAPPGLEGWSQLYSVPGRRAQAAAVYPWRDGRTATALFYFNAPPLEGTRANPAVQRKVLLNAVAEMKWRVPEMLKALEEASDFYFDRVSQIRLRPWAHERVALVGDAAYCASPMSGHGTSLALVGAYVLAGELAVAGGDHARAFSRYQSRMRTYVEGRQALAWRNRSFLLPRTRFGMWLRIQNLRILPHVPWRRLVARSAERSADATTLPDYGDRARVAQPTSGACGARA